MKKLQTEKGLGKIDTKGGKDSYKGDPRQDTKPGDFCFPAGYTNNPKHEAIALWRTTTMSRRTNTDQLNSHPERSLALLKDPCHFFLWEPQGASSLYGGAWQWSALSYCCHGGDGESWLTLDHNSSSRLAVVHKPEGEVHPQVPKRIPAFAIVNRDEYSWSFCWAFMKDVPDMSLAWPIWCKAISMDGMFHCQGTDVAGTVSLPTEFAQPICAMKEAQLLGWLLHHSYLVRGGWRFSNRRMMEVGHRPGPYPAFCWLWFNFWSCKIDRYLSCRTLSSSPWAKALAAAAARVNRFDLALLVLLGFSFFLRTMELLTLRYSHIRLFPGQGTVVIAIINSNLEGSATIPFFA